MSEAVPDNMALDSELIVQALPQYEIGEEVGQGGWGVVLRARHRQLDRTVAVKQLPWAIAADPAVQRRFLSEARVLASLDHPHIVPIYDYVEHEGLCLLVMELLPGGTVWERFTGAGVSAEAACGIVLAASTALEFAHRRGILHRDVKPENLLFTASGTVKVSDFGIAKVLGDRQTLATRTGEVMGTPAYMAPEQATGSELAPATDIYALGVLTYELLSGRLPFVDDGNPITQLVRRVQEQPTPLSEVAAHIPAPMADAVMQALATDPAERFTTAERYGMALADACNRAWERGWSQRSGITIMAAGPIADRLSGDPPVAHGPAPVVVTTAPDSGRRRGTVVPNPDEVVAVSELVSAAQPPPPPPPAPSLPPPPPPPAPSLSPPPRSPLARALIVGLPILLVVGVVAAILLARGGGEGSGSGSSSSSPLAVTVPGHESWVDTGIRVQAGATVRVTATGSVIHDNSTDPTLSSGPDGDTDRPDLRQFNVLSDVDHANLIGRIGTAGTPFVVGSELAFTADAAGRLFLGINDVGVFNNGGAYEARVSVRAP